MAMGIFTIAGKCVRVPVPAESGHGTLRSPGSTRGPAREGHLESESTGRGRATVTRFEPVHPGRWELDQSAGIQRDGEAQMAAQFLTTVRRLSDPALSFGTC